MDHPGCSRDETLAPTRLVDGGLKSTAIPPYLGKRKSIVLLKDSSVYVGIHPPSLMMQESCNRELGGSSVSAADIIAVGSNGNAPTSGKVCIGRGTKDFRDLQKLSGARYAGIGHCTINNVPFLAQTGWVIVSSGSSDHLHSFVRQGDREFNCDPLEGSHNLLFTRSRA